MSRTVYTFNQYHLGDNLIFLHLLRSLAKSHVSTPFIHFCHAHLIPQLAEAVNDLPNIILESFESELWKLRQHEAIDTWKNSQGHWESSANRWNWSAHTLEHHRWTAQRMGYSSPFTCREHLLFDYPALQNSRNDNAYDFLICNSEPSSGQFGPMAQHGSGYLDDFIFSLLRKGNRVVSTTKIVKNTDEAIFLNFWPCSGPGKFSVTEIGNLSMRCKHIIGIATGPLWPCMNVHNNHSHERRRFIAMLDNGEDLNLPHWEQCRNVNEVLEIAKTEGWV